MLSVIRQFSIKICSAVCSVHGDYYLEHKDYEVLAVRDNGEEDDCTWFLITNEQGEFDWISDENCKLGQLHDRFGR